MSATAGPDTSVRYRQALGNYPTGVSVVTAREADGTPVGMVVGTFTSISLDPPLVGFLPATSSTSWPKIRDAGSFCISVLSAEQEEVCRAFATKAEGRFEHHTDGDARSGSPRIADAVMWIDCDLDAVLPAGDHELVLGKVRGVEADDTRLPLLFHRGAYGTSQPMPRRADEGASLATLLRLSNAVREDAEIVAQALGQECMITSAHEGAIVSLASFGRPHDQGMSGVGSRIPLAAPLAPLLAAWADDLTRADWLRRGHELSPGVDLSWAEEELACVRRLGYQVTTGRAAAAHFERTVMTVDDLEGFAEVFQRIAERGPEPGLRAPLTVLTDVTSLAVPIHDGAGRVVLLFHLTGFTGNEEPARLQQCLDALIAAAVRASDHLAS